jgi:hypothetical protein
MSQIITIQINVMKLVREAFFKGDKGTYVRLTIFPKDEADQYGQFGMVKQDLGKERRDSGETEPIVGNAIRIWNSPSNGQGIAKQLRPPMQQATPVRGATDRNVNHRFAPEDDDIGF